MAYVAGALLGVIWLWFWLRGHWFAALLGMAPGVALWVAAGQINAWVVGFFVGAWVPFFGIRAYHRISRDLRTIAGADAPVTEQSTRLELR